MKPEEGSKKSKLVLNTGAWVIMEAGMISQAEISKIRAIYGRF